MLATIAVFLIVVAVREWLWARTSRFLLDKGEGQVRRGRGLEHLARERYAPEGYRWLAWYTVAYVATGLALLLVLVQLVSRLRGRPA